VSAHRDEAFRNGGASGVAAEPGGANRNLATTNGWPTAERRDVARVHSDSDAGDHALCAGRRVIGYVTVDRGTTGSPEAAITTIRDACDRWNLCLTEVVTDRESTQRSLERPGIGYALDQIARGNAEGLVIGELVRVVRSQVDMASFMQWFQERNAAVVALDLDIDTSTPEGARVAEVLIRLGTWERDRIVERTKTGLADARANGRPVGRPSISDRPELQARIIGMRARGMTLQAIADSLNAAGVRTLRGGARWRPSSVQAALGYRRPSASGARKPTESTFSAPHDRRPLTPQSGRPGR
jgi:DNA invertase Pin-like site-specific DNA recombinase